MENIEKVIVSLIDQQAQLFWNHTRMEESAQAINIGKVAIFLFTDLSRIRTFKLGQDPLWKVTENLVPSLMKGGWGDKKLLIRTKMHIYTLPLGDLKGLEAIFIFIWNLIKNTSHRSEGSAMGY